MRTVVLIDARYASKVIHRIGKDKQTLDYASLLSVLTNQFGCNVVSAQYYAPNDLPQQNEKEDAAKNRARKEAYHKNLGVLPPNGPGLVVREFDNKYESCKCPICKQEFQVQVQNAIDVMIATQSLKYALENLAECIAIFAPDSSYLRALKVVKERGKPIICIGSKADCQELASLSSKKLWLEEVWDFVALTRKKAAAAAASSPAPKIRTAFADGSSSALESVRSTDDFTDIEGSPAVNEAGYEENVDALLADYKKSTFDRRREKEDYGILLAEERRRRTKNGNISIEQEIEDRKIALQMQAEENKRAR